MKLRDINRNVAGRSPDIVENLRSIRNEAKSIASVPNHLCSYHLFEKGKAYSFLEELVELLLDFLRLAVRRTDDFPHGNGVVVVFLEMVIPLLALTSFFSFFL